MEELKSTRMMSVCRYYSRTASSMIYQATSSKKCRGRRVHYLKNGCPNIYTLVKKTKEMRNKDQIIRYVQFYDSGDSFPLCPVEDDYGEIRGIKWRSINGHHLSLLEEVEYKVCSSYVWFREQGMSIEETQSCVTMVFLLSSCWNSELVKSLSLLRYIMVSKLGNKSRIRDLLNEKMPSRVSSILTSCIMYRIYKSVGYEVGIEGEDADDDGEFTTEDTEYRLSFTLTVGSVREIHSRSSQMYLYEMYLNHLCSDKLTSSHHNYVQFISTMKEFEEKDDSYFDYDQRAVDMTISAVEDWLGEKAPYEDEPITVLIRSKGVLSMFPQESVKLYDEVIRYCLMKGRVPTVLEVAKDWGGKLRFSLLEKLQKQSAREIFKTDLECLCVLRVLERQADWVCRKLGFEYIVKSGDRKYLDFQRCVRNVKMSPGYKVFRTSDSSKWSTGDNPDIMKAIQSRLFTHTFDDFMDAVRERTLVPHNKNTRDALRIHGMTEPYIFRNGWPQGFFNKLSSLKHCLMSIYSLLLYQVKAGDVVTTFEFGVHSDDFFYAASFPGERESYTYECCLARARDAFCIRENVKKSSSSPRCCEFLSIFCFNGCLVAPEFKHIMSIMKDRPGTGYTSDLHSMVSRVRECIRMSVSDVWSSWAISYSNHLVRRDYSLLKGMSNCIDEGPSGYEWPEHCGGYYHCAPHVCLILGTRGCLYRLVEVGKQDNLTSLLPNHYPFIEDNDEYQQYEIDYSYLFLYPKCRPKLKSRLKKVKSSIGYMKTSPTERYELLCAGALSPERDLQIAYNHLSTYAARKMYSVVQQGLTRYYVSSCVKSKCVHWGESRITMKEAFLELRKTIPSEGSVKKAVCGFSPMVESLMISGTPVITGGVRLYNRPTFLCEVDINQRGTLGLKMTPRDLLPLTTFLEDVPERSFTRREEACEGVVEGVLGKRTIDSTRELEVICRVVSNRNRGNKYMFCKDRRLEKGYFNPATFLNELLGNPGNWKREVDIPEIIASQISPLSSSLVHSRLMSSENSLDHLFTVYNAVISGGMKSSELHECKVGGMTVREIVRNLSNKYKVGMVPLGSLRRVLMCFHVWGFDNSSFEESKRGLWRCSRNSVVVGKGTKVIGFRTPTGWKVHATGLATRDELLKVAYSTMCIDEGRRPNSLEVSMFGREVMELTRGGVSIFRGRLDEDVQETGYPNLKMAISYEPVMSAGVPVPIDHHNYVSWNEDELCFETKHMRFFPKVVRCDRPDMFEHERRSLECSVLLGSYSFTKSFGRGGLCVLKSSSPPSRKKFLKTLEERFSEEKYRAEGELKSLYQSSRMIEDARTHDRDEPELAFDLNSLSLEDLSGLVLDEETMNSNQMDVRAEAMQRGLVSSRLLSEHLVSSRINLTSVGLVDIESLMVGLIRGRRDKCSDAVHYSLLYVLSSIASCTTRLGKGLPPLEVLNLMRRKRAVLSGKSIDVVLQNYDLRDESVEMSDVMSLI
eukprot:PLAT6841.1.p1 GENE.PLAT6841.1~~PLAT6841.1.p1  ORF type:complete len:1626 (+),score=-468.24 PLAT6841.1:460-4878(+)